MLSFLHTELSSLHTASGRLRARVILRISYFAVLVAGKTLSILDGVPVAIKDEIDQVSYPTTVGTCFMGKIAVSHDAATVARLREACPSPCSSWATTGPKRCGCARAM